MGEIERAREEFFSEAQEIVEGLGRDLLALDEAQKKGRPDPDLINDVFRAVHTLKGLAGLFGANRMTTLSHELEELLDDLRLGRVELTASALDLLFRSVELYGKILQAEKDGRDPAIPQIDELIRELRRTGTSSSAAGGATDYELDPNVLAVLTEYEENRLRTNIAQGLSLYRLRVQFQLATIDQALDELKAAAKPHGEIITYLPTGSGADADSIELDILMASHESAGALRAVLGHMGVDLTEAPRRPPPEPVQHPTPTPLSPLPASMPAGRRRGGEPESSPSAVLSQREVVSAVPRGQEQGTIRSVAQTVRVDIHKLDHLMNIRGELAIVKSSLARMVDRLRSQHADRDLTGSLQQLERTFGRHLESMQNAIIEVRMVPLQQVFDKLSRVVRQLSRAADKQVTLVITGQETQVDKLIVEELSDPLMHMMRNAIDHGIESRALREAHGKPVVGTIALIAFQKGNHVVIEVQDDGKGIEADKLLEAGIRRGLVTADEARSASRREILNLVFSPGVTTKSDVSELSGRGVGMDVVKTNISKIGGVIDLQSEPGIGTKVTITLPITLAIISALLVRVGERLFAIPLANVQAAVSLDAESVRTIDGRDAVTFRGTTLQLCHLSRLFGLEQGAPAAEDEFGDAFAEPAFAHRRPGGVEDIQLTGYRPAQAPFRYRPAHGLSDTSPPGRYHSARRFIVVTAVGSRKLGLVVEALIGRQDVVIKALGPSLKNVRGFAGATELGDQRIALVLDTPALVEEAFENPDRLRLSHG